MTINWHQGINSAACSLSALPLSIPRAAPASRTARRPRIPRAPANRDTDSHGYRSLYLSQSSYTPLCSTTWHHSDGADAAAAAPAVESTEPVKAAAADSTMNGTHSNGTTVVAAVPTTVSADSHSTSAADSDPSVTSTTSPTASTTATASSTSTTAADSKPASSSSTRTTTRRAASLSSPPAATPAPATPYVILSVDAPNGRSARVEAVPSDLIVEIRHFLLSCPETCEYTQYHLEWQQQPLNDYAELGMYDGLVKAAGGTGGGEGGRVEVLKMVNEWYDERGVRLHVRRVREMLVSPPCHVQTSLVLTLDEQQEREKKRKEKGESKRRGQAKENSGVAADADAADGADKMDEAFSSLYSLPSAAATAPAASTSTSSPPISLADYQSHLHATPPSPPVLSCLHSLTYSAYNPPPPSRKLRGDLLYLVVHTLENNRLHITAAIDGFYVNQSTDDEWSGDISSSGYKSHSLLELLRKASPLFHTRFSQNLARRVMLHPFQQSDVLVTANSWLTSKTEHRADEGRAEDALLQTYGMDVRGAMRDWNEEYQSCVEMDVVGEDERVRRDSHLHRVYSEYVLAAREAASAILNGHIAPVNALDPPRQHVYIYNSIFFSHAVDGRSLYSPPLTPQQADTIFHKQANADLQGVNRYINLHVPHLHTLATAIVDCRGRRLIAQSIIPGIFHSDRASKHVYGSMDQGETVLKGRDGDVGEEVETVLRAASVRVHVSVHGVLDAKGEEVEVVAAVDTKGIVGSDHRFYALDLMRTTPRDAGRREPKDTWAVMRPELVERYVRRVAMDRMFSADAAGDKEKDGAAGIDGDGGKEERQLRLMLAEQMKGNRDIDAQYIDTINSVTFNPDLLLHTKHTLIPPTSSTTTAELAALTALSTFLLSSVIPQFVTSAALLEQPAADGEELTRLLHEAGINVRWLGAVCREAEKRGVRWLAWMCTVEMVVRAIKCIMREEMREVEAGRQLVGTGRVEGWYYGSVIVRGLNGVLGKRGLGVGVTEDELTTATAVLKQHRDERDKQQQAEMDGVDRPKKATTAPHHSHGNKKSKRPTHTSASSPSSAATVLRLPDGRKAPVDPLSAVNVWVAIRGTVKDKYGIELPSAVALSGGEKLGVLRAVCRRLGVVVVAKEYDLVGSSEPFTLDDVTDVLPVVKQLDIVNEDAEQLVQSAVASLHQGHLSYAYQYLSDAMQSHNALYGPMHVRTAAVYQLLALTCYQAGDVAAAVDFAQRCVLIYERVCGMDDARTAHAHLALALYLQTSGHSDAAAVHCQHALWIYELLAGENSVYAAAACSNLAMICQSKGRLRDGLRWCEEALKRNIAALGDNHVQVGLCYHSLAVAHAFLGSYRVSVDNEKKCKQLLAASLTTKHARVQQSQTWLDHFTSLAVKAANTPTNATATAASSAAALSGLSIVPPALGLSSPFAWLSFDRRMKGRLGLDDVLALVEVSARGEERRKEEMSRVADSEVEGSVAAMGEAEADAEAEAAGQEGGDDVQYVNGGTTAAELRKAAAVSVAAGGGKSRKEKRKKAAKAKREAQAAAQ